MTHDYDITPRPSPPVSLSSLSLSLYTHIYIHTSYIGSSFLPPSFFRSLNSTPSKSFLVPRPISSGDNRMRRPKSCDRLSCGFILVLPDDDDNSIPDTCRRYTCYPNLAQPTRERDRSTVQFLTTPQTRAVSLYKSWRAVLLRDPPRHEIKLWHSAPTISPSIDWVLVLRWAFPLSPTGIKCSLHPSSPTSHSRSSYPCTCPQSAAFSSYGDVSLPILIIGAGIDDVLSQYFLRYKTNYSMSLSGVGGGPSGAQLMLCF